MMLSRGGCPARTHNRPAAAVDVSRSRARAPMWTILARAIAEPGKGRYRAAGRQPEKRLAAGS